MHFNVYMDDQTGQLLSNAAQQQGQPRNALIRQAVSELLARHNQPKWPEEVLGFQGVADMSPFEAGREQLKPLAFDPLA